VSGALWRIEISRLPWAFLRIQMRRSTAPVRPTAACNVFPLLLRSFDDRAGAYVPHAKGAIKQRVEQLLRSRAK
jgi:hypothetical protein